MITLSIWMEVLLTRQQLSDDRRDTALDENKTTNGWNEWAKAVLRDIEEGKEFKKEMMAKMENIMVNIAVLQTKFEETARREGASSGRTWGIISAVVVSLIGIIVSRLLGGK